MSPPALFLIGHGTRSPEGTTGFHAFTRRLAARRPGTAVGAGLIEFAQPTLEAGLDALVAAGARRVVAVPLVLVPAGHLKDDGPVALAAARRRHGGLETAYARELGVHPAVLAAAEDTAAAAGGRQADAVVVVGRGSTDPDANADLAKAARLLADHRGLGTGGDPGRPLGLVEPAFVSLAPPDVPTALERCWHLGARRITVVPWFLFSGVLPDRIAAQSAAWAADHPGSEVAVAGLLGDDDRLLDLVWERYDEACDGPVVMNCDGCQYRVALPGYEDRVGAPPLER